MFEVSEEDRGDEGPEENTASTAARERQGDHVTAREEDQLSNDSVSKKATAKHINKLLLQVKKLKIIWYKSLRRLKLLEEFRDVLNELGILDEVEQEEELLAAGSDVEEAPSYRKLKSIKSENLALYSDQGKNKSLSLRNQSAFFINRLAEKSKLPNRSMGEGAKSQGHASQLGSDNGKANSLMQYMSASNRQILLSQVEKNGFRGKIKKAEERDMTGLSALDIEMLVSKLRVLDFLVPYDQIEITSKEGETPKVGKWLNGLFVSLHARQVSSELDTKQLLNEVKILKNIRHPNLEMTLGVTFNKKVRVTGDNIKVATYEFFLVTQNSELQA
jgi:hypothetical protein